MWQCSYVHISGFGSRRSRSLFPPGGDCHHQRVSDARPFYTACPKQSEKIDLDRWKAVMKTQSASFEQQKELDEDDEEEEEDGTTKQQGSTSLDTLEAAQNLVSMWRYAGKQVPQEMTADELKILAELTTRSARKKYLKYLAIREGHKINRKEKQQQKRATREASLELKQEQAEEKKDAENRFFLQFWSKTEDRHYAWRSAQAMQFGQPLVFDMSYESNMNRREVQNTVSQLLEVEGWNRRAADPYHLHFCNLDPEGEYQRQLLKRYGADAWNRLLITSTPHHYVDVFPHDRLVYLTADSPNVLRTYDHSKVYIIGALVDRSIKSGLSFANAKRLKLNTARLPLDEYLHWEIGAKNLTLDQMIRIMSTVKETGKWEEALKFVPSRKHDGLHQKQTPGEITRPVKSFNRSSEFSKQNEDRTFVSANKFSLKDSLRSGNKKLPETRVRTSFSSYIRDGKGFSKRKHWLDEE
ncbi:tRNA methyltransferase 10 homolog C [Synchiropus splendidus]|uniref:tRNA methyltransferase 10 homolog C n=1 Tax=Synchiropus splendidus TaxID=270530 RepID=UPI00237EB5E8|nr:tRNA methyltransferase 10 homolog C [Synchiropus splendidus]